MEKMSKVATILVFFKMFLLLVHKLFDQSSKRIVCLC